MSMNQVIQRRRRELGMTQEQVAQALNVTAPAVNKWEKGATCPDVSLLAPLARLLKIDLNELLCFREELTAEEIARFSGELVEAVRRDGLAAGLALAAEELRQYPRCDALLFQCAVSLEGAAMLYADGDAREACDAQLDAWYERCSASEDESIRKRAIYMLAGRYLRREDAANAQRMLDLLPEEPPMDKRLLQARIHLRQNQMEEAGRVAAQALLRCLNEARSFLWQLIDIERSSGNPDDAEEMSQLSSEMTRRFGLWDYNAAIAPLNLALERRDAAESLRLLRQLLDAAAKPWRPGDTLLFRRLDDGRPAADMRPMLDVLLRSLETDPAYDFLRAEPEFRALITKHSSQSKL